MKSTNRIRAIYEVAYQSTSYGITDPASPIFKRVYKAFDLDHVVDMFHESLSGDEDWASISIKELPLRK